MDRRRVVLVDIPGQKGYLPLAAGYLVATARADPVVAQAFHFDLLFPDITASIDATVDEVLTPGGPAIVAFSLQGWALRFADMLAARVHAKSPASMIIYGGNHVTNQGYEFVSSRAFLKAIASGEGEFIFLDVLRAMNEEEVVDAALAKVPGVSFRRRDGSYHEGERRERIVHLSAIPSPYLTRVLNPSAHWVRTALLETNRGCPYKCAFCYWGAAVNSKLRLFDLGRVFEEMQLLAEQSVESWYICDANFGMLKRDSVIVDEIIALKERYGYPSVVHVNWAKNSNERIVSIAARLSKAGVHSTFTIAAQSTDEHTLELAQRTNMSINQIGELARLCRREGVVPRGELIFGLPGESYGRFLASFDELVEHTDAISVYPHYVLPNTHYDSHRTVLGIQTETVEFDTGYEYCVAHNSLTRDDFQRGMEFVIANNILKVGGNVLVVYGRAASIAAGIKQSHIVETLAAWLVTADDPIARSFAPFFKRPTALHRHSLGHIWDIVRTHRNEFLGMIGVFAEESFHRRLPTETALLLRQALRYDSVLYPILDDAEREADCRARNYETDVEFDFDFLSFQKGESSIPKPGTIRYTIRHRKGLWRYPIDKWYFGLLSFRGTVDYATRVSQLSASGRDQYDVYG